MEVEEFSSSSTSFFSKYCIPAAMVGEVGIPRFARNDRAVVLPQGLKSLLKRLFIATSAPEGVVEKVALMARPKRLRKNSYLLDKHRTPAAKADLNFSNLRYA
jgi:hypothetical protein